MVTISACTYGVRFFGFKCALLGAAFIITAAWAFAQLDNARISGTVQDATGAVIGGGKVTLVNNATGVRRSDATSTVGVYVIQDIEPGEYTLEVTKEGF